MLGSIESHDYLAATFAAESGHEVVSVEYHLASEHPFPAGLEDCIAVTQALASDGKVAVAGDSAGGNLAAVVANEVPVLAQLLLYPVTDSVHELPSYERYARGYILTRDTMRHFRRAYSPNAVTRALARVSQLRTVNLNNSAPAFIAVAQCDVCTTKAWPMLNGFAMPGSRWLLKRLQARCTGFALFLGLKQARNTVKKGSQWLDAKFV